MFRSPHCRGAIGLAATTLLVAQGCHVYRPTTLPVPKGSEMRVEGARLEIYKGPVVHPAPAECHATRVDGKLFDAKGDTLTMVPVRWVSGSSPRRACSRLTTATIVAAPDSTRVLARQFSPWRTTGAVVGTVAVVSAIALVVVVSEYGRLDWNMQASR